MAEKTIGVLGGMGPEATKDLFGKIIANTPASVDQEHLRVIIDSNPHVPDRTAAILRGGESPVPVMKAGAEALKRAGADFIVIPCVSAHFFLEELRSQITLPVISIFDATVEHIRTAHPHIRKIGLLATIGTLEGGRFQDCLERGGIGTLLPDHADREKIMRAVYEIKGADAGRSRSEIGREVRDVANRLLAQGAQGIVAGCTEIPLVLRSDDLSAPLFDTLLLLARAAIKEAGLDPIPLQAQV